MIVTLESEIIDCEFPLHTAPDVIDYTKDLVVQLFYGFLYFMHYKCGLTPKFTDQEEVELHGSDLDDPFTWVEFLMSVDRGHGEPYSFRHFADKNDDIHTVTVLIDTHVLFECGMMLNETRLEGESRFSYSEMAREFHVEAESFPRMLAYFKYLYGAGWEHGHTLVLRPTKMMEYLATLDRNITSQGGCPDQVIRIDEWEKMPRLEKIATSMIQRMQVCNEANFLELLRKRSIEIPNVQFLNFYEYIRDKIPSWAVSEWKDVRDRYIAQIKVMIGYHLNLDRTGLGEAKKVLAGAGKLFREKRFTESLSRSYISMEGFLNASVRRPMSIPKKIDVVTSSLSLRSHRAGLIFIKETRNALQHSGGISECNEDNARLALDIMNRFLTGVDNSPYDARDTQPFCKSGVLSSTKTTPGQSAGQDAKWEDLVVGAIRELSMNDGSWVMLADVGNRLRATNPAFDPRNEGFENLHSMIESKPDVFVLGDNMINGVSSGHRVRLKAG